MGLSSIFKRPDTVPVSPPVGDAVDPVQQARTRARRRLIGAAVLLMAGVIVFPLVFETRPRPVAIDVPIEIPRKDGAPALSMPPARPAPPPTSESTAPPLASAAPAVRDGAGERVHESPVRPAAPARLDGSDRSASRPVQSAAAPSVEATSPLARSGALGVGAAPDASRKPAPTAAESTLGDGSRAKGLLEGKAAAASAVPGAMTSGEAPRFVVQVGAFAEGNAARDVRAKAEKLGLKTYTQVAQTPAGNRIRVRVGPFGTRAEADAALAKARSAGLSAVVLTL